MLSWSKSFIISKIEAERRNIYFTSNRQDYGVYVNEIEKLVRLYKVTWVELIKLTLSPVPDVIW